MGSKKHYLSLIALLSCGASMMAQDFFDDIYYNPKKDKTQTTVSSKKATKTSPYIANMGEMDVDTYNRRNQYYVSQIDTIGYGVENGEDFIYTQQIQKFYNPTVVVDNAAALGDVLSNAYGNVEIVINNNGYPVFAPYYGWNWPYYGGFYLPWYWGVNIGSWGWGIGWYDPWYAWNWGWGPGWWNPGPSWGWGPPPGPAWRPLPGPMASWSPNGNRPVGPRPGWGSGTQHRGNMAMGSPVGGNYHRPGGGQVSPGYQSNHNGGMQPPHTGVVNNNGKWQYNTSRVTGHRNVGTGVLPGNSRQPSVGNAGNNRPGSSSNGSMNNHRTSGNSNKTTVTSPSRSNNRNVGTSRSNAGNRSIGGASRSTGGGNRGGGGGGRHR